jgi:sec-independent protein translocase protein TatA
MGDLLQPTHLLVIGILLLVLFGAKRLPELGKGLGEGLKGFKEGLKGINDNPQAQPPAPPVQTQQAAPPPPASNAPVEQR